MRPELLDPLWVLLCWAALFALLPKRGGKTLAGRLDAVRSGRRLHVLGPPLVLPAAPREGSLARLRRLLVAESRRLLELGVILWIVCLVAEEHGRSRRRARLEDWQAAPSGLLLLHLAGELGSDRFQAAVAQLSCPLAPKATRQPRPRLMVPAADSLLHWRPTDADSSDAVAQVRTETRPELGLAVQTLGALRIATPGGVDLTAGLLKRPTLAFIWQYLLTRSLLNSRPGVHRDAVADELYPGIGLSQQRRRLSHRLYDMQKFLVPELLAPIVIGEVELAFDLGRCQVDAAMIFALAEEAKKTESLLARPLVEDISEVLATTSEEFLPDWEDLEQAVSEGRGSSGDLLRQVRLRIEEARVTLLVALGDHQLAARNPGKAVLALEEAHGLRPDLVDVVSKLIDAFEAAGQPARARELQRRGLGRDQPA